MKKSDQEKIIWPWLERARRSAIDSTGLGIGWADDAQDKYGKYRVEAVNFSAPVKEALAYPVRGNMEDRTLRIPDVPRSALIFGSDQTGHDCRQHPLHGRAHARRSCRPLLGARLALHAR